ncbi:HK97 family phage prohead protease [Anaerosacchariphilus polymeriproducens]|uniref:HK97 family phage prohead protease n=1 Tax=Anaerosacchariphilus polymeriproducens TaxID=1812858 RepID=A0A371AT67_9FIRM|nr:HK97 family phage prohead protease [Anaerosacchariphilus polymeriproducens]RDU22766.1 HK97 family phage prohead protease [Anaerosacchariphilus polymeriproducens]
MNVEIRADSIHISGYVNVVKRESRPVITSRGKVIEMIEERAFQRALEKADNIPMTLDHNSNRVLAQTNDSTLELYEDNIGLRAEAVITDEEAVNGAKNGKLKGWSFGMKKIVDSIEERADKLPLRTVKDFVLDHVTLVMNRNPVYASTSIELRADDEIEMEVRANETEINIKNMVETPKKPDLTQYKNRINNLKVGK